MSKTIAIIPARGGSKRLPKKNLLELGGVPLIVHSIKYAQKDIPPIINITAIQNKKNITILIKDNGRGIKQNQEKLFKQLSQEQNTNSIEDGIGLGLYITQKIAQLHKASIAIENNKNQKGSTVTLVFNL